MAAVGVILAGCGYLDGAEIHESVLTLLALDRAGVDILCYSVNLPQVQVRNHLHNTALNESRNILLESARIARGKISDISEAKVPPLDAVIMPGGYGALLNFSDCAQKGPAGTVHPEVARILSGMVKAKKPIGVMCIAPVIMASVAMSLGLKVTLTIGNDPRTAKDIDAMGCTHIPCSVNDIVIDQDNKIVSTPAYMLANRISEAATGIEKLVGKVLQML